MNNKSFDIIIDTSNYSSIVSNCCKQRIDEIQYSFLEKLIAIKSNFIEMYNVSFDVFKFDCQLTFQTMSNEMFWISFYIKSSFFDTNDIEHRFIKIMIVRFVNRIEEINTRSKFRVKNSDIWRIIFVIKFILVIQFELMLIFFQFCILLNFFK